MEIKKMLSTGLIILGVSIPVLVQATTANLTIVNNTNRDSTSIINHGVCSTILGSSGVTKAHSTNVVDEATINRACFFNKKNCQADVYMTNNCSGPKIATIIFDATDINVGLKSIELFDHSYSIYGNGLQITLDGGPTEA